MTEDERKVCPRLLPDLDAPCAQEGAAAPSVVMPAAMPRRALLKIAGGTLAAGMLARLAAPADILAGTASSMKIVMVTGSPHRRGTSALLADEFTAGAVSKGHSVTRFDAAFLDIGPCRGCYHCKKHNGECVQKDDMGPILAEILAADMLVLVTPLYFYNMTAQLKAVIDRLLPGLAKQRRHPMKTAMLVTCGSSTDWNMDAIPAQYSILRHNLPWQDMGVVLAKKVFRREDIEGTAWPAAARALGASL